MPKQRRYAIKQTLGSVIKEIDRAQAKLVGTGKFYAEHHPDYYDRFASIVTALENIKVVITQLSDSI